MGLSITLPAEVQERVQDIAIQKGKRVENVVIAAVMRYVAHEQRTIPSGDILAALKRSQRLYQGFKDRLRQRYSSLGNFPQAQIVVTMERLSEKVAAGMAFATWQEAETFLKDGHPLR